MRGWRRRAEGRAPWRQAIPRALRRASSTPFATPCAALPPSASGSRSIRPRTWPWRWPARPASWSPSSKWLTEAGSRELTPSQRQAAADEIADVQLYLVALADQLGLDIPAAVAAKMRKNALKYPAERFRGSARKYNDESGR
ncbi:MazG nucleotide pyrophosphohydrolase domain protein [Bordetella bronchiseptica D993]|nr:MazG nucleotide pyrophosphohydrolase domain protein [Bordetella bronchiseptica D993]